MLGSCIRISFYRNIYLIGRSSCGDIARKAGGGKDRLYIVDPTSSTERLATGFIVKYIQASGLQGMG